MDRSDTVLVKANSRRAAKKLRALVPSHLRQEYFSIIRSTGRGAYRIPKELGDEAKAITGVTGMRDGRDLHKVWETSGRHDPF